MTRLNTGWTGGAPIVIYAPVGTEVRHRLWTGSDEVESAGVE